MDLDVRTIDPQAAARYFEAKAAFSTGPAELEAAIAHGRHAGTDFNLIDLRRPEDFVHGHLPGAVNLPEERWSSHEGLTPDRLNLLYGYTPVCHLTARAAVPFARAGFPVMEIDGGFQAWEEYGFTIDRGKIPFSPGLSSFSSEPRSEALL